MADNTALAGTVTSKPGDWPEPGIPPHLLTVARLVVGLGLKWVDGQWQVAKGRRELSDGERALLTKWRSLALILRVNEQVRVCACTLCGATALVAARVGGDGKKVAPTARACYLTPDCGGRTKIVTAKSADVAEAIA